MYTDDKHVLSVNWLLKITVFKRIYNTNRLPYQKYHPMKHDKIIK